MSEMVARVRITLKDIEPEIWRRVAVPLDISLKGLHDVIQAVMAWQDYHLFEFRISDRVYGTPDPEWVSDRKVYQARLARLETFVAQGVTAFDYVYDMGDNWEHVITIEAVEAGDDAQKYPLFIEGARRAPPEDVGSVPGYYEFLEAVTTPRHRERKRMLEWHGRLYDPDEIDALIIRLRLGDIARRRHTGKLAAQRRRSS